MQRWFAGWDNIDEGMRYCSRILLMALICRGFEYAWAEQAADLLSYAMCRAFLVGLTTTSLPSSVAVVRSVKASSDLLHRLRSECSCTEHTVAAILSNQLGVRCMLALSVLVGPTRQRHGEARVAALLRKAGSITVSGAAAATAEEIRVDSDATDVAHALPRTCWPRGSCTTVARS